MGQITTIPFVMHADLSEILWMQGFEQHHDRMCKTGERLRIVKAYMGTIPSQIDPVAEAVHTRRKIPFCVFMLRSKVFAGGDSGKTVRTKSPARFSMISGNSTGWLARV